MNRWVNDTMDEEKAMGKLFLFPFFFFCLAPVGQMGLVVTITCWGSNLDLIVGM